MLDDRTTQCDSRPSLVVLTVPLSVEEDPPRQCFSPPLSVMKDPGLLWAWTLNPKEPTAASRPNEFDLPDLCRRRHVLHNRRNIT